MNLNEKIKPLPTELSSLTTKTTTLRKPTRGYRPIVLFVFVVCLCREGTSTHQVFRAKHCTLDIARKGCFGGEEELCGARWLLKYWRAWFCGLITQCVFSVFRCSVYLIKLRFWVCVVCIYKYTIWWHSLYSCKLWWRWGKVCQFSVVQEAQKTGNWARISYPSTSMHWSVPIVETHRTW